MNFRRRCEIRCRARSPCRAPRATPLPEWGFRKCGCGAYDRGVFRRVCLPVRARGHRFKLRQRRFGAGKRLFPVLFLGKQVRKARKRPLVGQALPRFEQLLHPDCRAVRILFGVAKIAVLLQRRRKARLFGGGIQQLQLIFRAGEHRPRLVFLFRKGSKPGGTLGRLGDLARQRPVLVLQFRNFSAPALAVAERAAGVFQQLAGACRAARSGKQIPYSAAHVSLAHAFDFRLAHAKATVIQLRRDAEEKLARRFARKLRFGTLRLLGDGQGFGSFPLVFRRNGAENTVSLPPTGERQAPRRAAGTEGKALVALVPSGGVPAGKAVEYKPEKGKQCAFAGFVFPLDEVHSLAERKAAVLQLSEFFYLGYQKFHSSASLPSSAASPARSAFAAVRRTRSSPLCNRGTSAR